MTAQMSTSEPWSLAHRAGFRFAFVYLLLYSFPQPLSSIPGLETIFEPYEKLWIACVPWVAKHLFSLDITVMPNGSGDTTFNYVQVVCYALLALAATLLWSILARNAREHRRLRDGLRTYVRYVLAVTMLGYGMAKVIKTQFPFPSPDRLTSTYGESSPMGLLWTFMGYSPAYNAFTGGGEALGCLLLFFRRTTTLGTLLLIAVLANVVMLNFCYDVPVKLYSLHLLAMCGYLALPDARRLFDVLIAHRPTVAPSLREKLPWHWMERVRPWAKLAFIGWIVFQTIRSGIEMQAQYGDSAVRPELYGLWEVESFEPVTRSDSLRWTQMSINAFGYAGIKHVDKSQAYFRYELAEDKQSLSLLAQGQPAPTVFKRTQPDPEHLVLETEIEGTSISIHLKHVDMSKFLLVNRGFHWINEFPFNR